MKSSKKRDFSGKRMKLITVAIEEPILDDMVGLAPRESYGTIIEALVKGAVRRRAKRNTSIKSNSLVTPQS